MAVQKAVAYLRTSSATNVGIDKDSDRRQREAIGAYSKYAGYRVVKEFYDAAVSGAEPVNQRPGFAELLDYCSKEDISVVLVESAGRFARDLLVQITGHQLLQERGIELIPVDAPTAFTDPSPTSELIRQVLGAVQQFDRASLVGRLQAARDRKRAATGRCEGPPPIPLEVVKAARLLARKPRKGKPRSLRQISQELAKRGYLSRSGKPYGPSSVSRMLSTTSPSRKAA